MEALAWSGKLLVGQRAFGEGDSFILGAFGSVFRVQAIPQILLIGISLQLLIIFPMFIKNLFKKKEYKLLSGLAGFVLTIILFKVLEHLNLLNNLVIFLSVLLSMLFFAFYSCKKLIVSAKNPEQLTFVPFGPPLVIASLYLIFI